MRQTEIIFQDAADCAEAVPPVDFLALCVGTATVGNGDFVNWDTKLRDLGRDLRFESKMILVECELLKHFAFECFGPALHIGEIQIREHVAEQGQELIADGMPKVEDAMRVRSPEA